MPELSKTLRAVLCGAFCVIVLTAMLVRHAWPLMTGEPIYLEVIARDPRDLFRGDYVVLSYPIDQLEVRRGDTTPILTSFPAATGLEPVGKWWDEIDAIAPDEFGDYEALSAWRDRILYVQLEPRPLEVPGVQQVHAAKSVSDTPVAGSVNLKGRIRSISRLRDDQQALSVTLEMHYGIDALYVQEGTGLEIEAAIRAGKVHAIVMVTSSGDARLSDLVIDGRPWSSIKAGE